MDFGAKVHFLFQKHFYKSLSRTRSFIFQKIFANFSHGVLCVGWKQPLGEHDKNIMNE